MLFKLSLSNIRKSMRDYAIYFFTLVIGVSIFYVFNAIGSQTAMMKMNERTDELVKLLVSAISGTSVFVAAVLGLLIVYASRFLMKRRNREFALYMMLGMSKGKISAILFIETLVIGIGSLFIGLLAGIGLSQLMSALVANLFDADMTAYKFTVSGKAIVKTIIYFAVMYLVVVIFNSFVVTKMKLIDLMQSGRKAETIKLKNPWLCVILFILAVCALGYAYYQVGWRMYYLNPSDILIYIAVGCISTVLIFWSVSGMLLRVLMSMKKAYHSGLNAFTFRQISSTINTMVLSMSVICLMLFVTVCALTSAFSIRNSMNESMRTLCPADYEFISGYDPDDHESHRSLTELCSEHGYDLSEDFSDYAEFRTYTDHEFTLGSFLGDKMDDVREKVVFMFPELPEEYISISEYNRIMEIFGKEKLTLDDDSYILTCNYKDIAAIRETILSEGREITISGHTLKPQNDKCVDGFVHLSANRANFGLFIVPDEVIDEKNANYDCFLGNYRSEDKEAANKTVHDRIDEVMRKAAENEEQLTDVSWLTKIEISAASIGLGAIMTFLGLYIGLVFLIASGVILALKVLSESTDSIGRYEMLRKIGAEESDITRSLFRQTSLFFLLPLLLGVLHSVFGMKFSIFFMQFFGTEGIFQSVLLTSAILLLIYGGYFLITFLCSRNIIRGRR